VPDAIRDQLSHRAPPSRGLDLEAPIQRVVKLDSGFHANKLTIVLGRCDGAGGNLRPLSRHAPTHHLGEITITIVRDSRTRRTSRSNTPASRGVTRGTATVRDARSSPDRVPEIRAPRVGVNRRAKERRGRPEWPSVVATLHGLDHIIHAAKLARGVECRDRQRRRLKSIDRDARQRRVPFASPSSTQFEVRLVRGLTLAPCANRS